MLLILLFFFIVPVKSFANKINDNIYINMSAYSSAGIQSVLINNANKLSENIKQNEKDKINAYLFIKGDIELISNFQYEVLNFDIINFDLYVNILAQSNDTIKKNDDFSYVFDASVSSLFYGTVGFRYNDLITSQLLNYNPVNISDNFHFDYGSTLYVDNKDRSGDLGRPIPSLYYITPDLFNNVKFYLTFGAGLDLHNHHYDDSSYSLQEVANELYNLQVNGDPVKHYEHVGGTGQYMVWATGVDAHKDINPNWHIDFNISYLYKYEEPDDLRYNNGLNVFVENLYGEVRDSALGVFSKNFEKITQEVSIGASIDYSDFLNTTFNYRFSNILSPQSLLSFRTMEILEYKKHDQQILFAKNYGNDVDYNKMFNNNNHYISASINLRGAGFDLSNNFYYGINNVTVRKSFSPEQWLIIQDSLGVGPLSYRAKIIREEVLQKTIDYNKEIEEAIIANTIGNNPAPDKDNPIITGDPDVKDAKDDLDAAKIELNEIRAERIDMAENSNFAFKFVKTQISSFRYHLVLSYDIIDNAINTGDKIRLMLEYYHSGSNYFANKISEDVFSFGISYDL